MAKDALSKNNDMLNERNIVVTKSNENSTIFIGNLKKTWNKQEVNEKVKRIVIILITI